MALIIHEREREKLYDHARAGYPHEVVGLLAGDRSTSAVSHVEALVNERADSPQNRYAVSALTLFRAEERLAHAGLEVLGYYHSHPDETSRYSEFDRDHALPNTSYLIVSVRGGEVASTQSWRLREDRSAMDEENVETPVQSLE